jgi:hypothetical protein
MTAANGHNARMKCLILLAVCGACATTQEARAIQPFPHGSAEALAASVPLYIHERNMHLPHDYQLRSAAQFAVVSRDRAVFHVNIARYEEDDADTSGWTAWLVDDQGDKYAPETRETPRVDRVQVDWALYPGLTSAECLQRDQICKRRIVPGYQVYDGVADISFLVPGLFTEKQKRLTLVLRHGSEEMVYTWIFGDHTEVKNYGRTKVDDEIGTIVLPGPDTQVAGTRAEGGPWQEIEPKGSVRHP